MSGGDHDRGERGQMLAFFAITLVAIIGVVGLVIDGGDTFVQRREQQNVADNAAMAAGYAYANGLDPAAAAQSIASANGYTNGANSTTVAVGINSNNFTVTITRPHRNAFAGIMGFASWNVSTTATSIAGVPNGVYGAMPLIFNIDAYNAAANRIEGAPATFGEPASGSNDVPLTTTSFNWTVYCTASGSDCNADSHVVDQLIGGQGETTTVYLDDEIRPLNAGSHTTEYSGLAGHVGDAYPVGIVDDSGQLVLFAMFHITGSVGGSTKQISGWFDTDMNLPNFTISPTGGNPYTVYGGYKVYLTN